MLTLTMLGAVAQMEREQIGERTRAALAYKRGLGERVGTVPLGFRLTASGGPMAPVPVELEVVRYILGERRAGTAFRTIARELAAEGLPTKQGGRWHASTVRAVWEGRDRYMAVLGLPAAPGNPGKIPVDLSQITPSTANAVPLPGSRGEPWDTGMSQKRPSLDAIKPYPQS